MKTNATLATLAFYAKYAGWHSYNTTHRATIRAVHSLSKRGFLEVDSDLHMARFTGKIYK
jgi:hypothetical protein